MIIAKIWDSFVEYDEKELFLCETNKGKLWFHEHEIPKTLLTAFKKKIKTRREFENKENEAQLNKQAKKCEVDKTDAYSADIKCRTRGIIIACYNCGVIAGFKEMLCAESLQQVAALFLEIFDYYTDRT